MTNILWISFFIPYDNVGHASGKTENYYIKRLAALDEYHIELITIAEYKEIESIDLDKYGIEYEYALHHYKGFHHLYWGLISRIYRLNIFNGKSALISPYIQLEMKKMIHRKVRCGYKPDIIILQWTQVVFFVDFIKKEFPGIPIVAIEEDVVFLSFFRQYQLETRQFAKWIRKQRYNSIKQLELNCLKNAEMIILNNEKDKKLLKDNNIIGKEIVWNPFFDSYFNVTPHFNNHDILFFGAMFRQENWMSAIWFIKNVMPLIKYKNSRFVVVGNRPHPELLKYQSKRVVITGFVKDIKPYLENATCMVAPLVMGAGIKVKVLECMTAGLPVLTNGIGIEGIPAKNGEEYLYCETPEEYAQNIELLFENIDKAKRISVNARNFVRIRYDLESSFKMFENSLTGMKVN